MACGPNDVDLSLGAWNKLTNNAPWGVFPAAWSVLLSILSISSQKVFNTHMFRYPGNGPKLFESQIRLPARQTTRGGLFISILDI